MSFLNALSARSRSNKMTAIIHPNSYQEEFQDFPYQDLVRIRDQLLKDIRAFEINPNPWDDYTEISEAGSPYTEYAVNLLHLSEICLMIIKSYPVELEERLEKERTALKTLTDNLTEATDDT